MPRRRTEEEEKTFLASSRTKVLLDDKTLQQMEKRAAELGLSRERLLGLLLRGMAGWSQRLSSAQLTRFEYVIRNPDRIEAERLMKAVDGLSEY